jgi:hypothetical protein
MCRYSVFRAETSSAYIHARPWVLLHHRVLGSYVPVHASATVWTAMSWVLLHPVQTHVDLSTPITTVIKPEPDVCTHPGGI